MSDTLATTPSADAIDWARRLVAIDTRSSESNRPLVETIADHLRGLGIPLRLTWDDARRKANLFATIGPDRPGGLVLSGHTDTVPWDGQAWTRDPLAAEVSDGRLWGRGSADMKGWIGVVTALAGHWLQADLPVPIHLAFSYDEEVGCFGVRHLLADLKDAGVAPRLCWVGEPTGNVPALAHKGVHRWRCRVKGRPAHSSLTPTSVNAVEAAARVIAHIADLADGWRAHGPRQDGFDVPFSTAAVCVVEGGIADNVVPEDARFHYEFRNLPGADALAMQAAVEARARSLEPAMHAVDPATGFRFESIASVPAFQAAPDEPVVRLVMRLARAQRTTLVAFGTEAGLFQAAGLSSVVCGPGSIEQAHQPDEFVTLAQLAAAEAALRGITAEALADG